MDLSAMIVIGTGVVEKYLTNALAGNETALIRLHYRAWLLIVGLAHWRNSGEVKQSYPKAAVLDDDLVAFGINEGKYILSGRVRYAANIFAIQFFGTPAEYDCFKGEAIDGRSANLD